VDDFYAARSRTIPPLPWSNIAPPFSAIRSVAKLRPKAFTFENVPHLASGHRAYFDYLVKALALPTIAKPDEWSDDAERLDKILASGQTFDPSYVVSVHTLLAADFGTGQKRKRLFITGIRRDIEAEFEAPAPTHSAEQLMEDQWLTGTYWDRHGLERPIMSDAGLKWLRKHNRNPRDLFAPRLEAHRTVRDVLASIPDDAANNEAAPREAKAYKGHTGSPIDEASKTLRAGDHGVSGGENMIQYNDLIPIRYRHYTVREAAAISDFPHDYRFDGTWSDGLKQIGNAVPCNLGKAMGQSLKQTLLAT
ncbi:DNA cytosine methyltransferase, partial [Croceicoccus gelatinilyticus]|uniref:DNA cytosine methyltransferase n=1 Tax=Croceicoccus gelatinilyticus TaxID=2835536 RepID=UPI001BCE8928